MSTAAMAIPRSRPRQGTNGFRIAGALLAFGYVALLLWTIGGTVVSLFLGQEASSIIARTIAVRGLGESIVNSLILLVTTVPLALVMAILFAWLNERTDASMGWVSRLLPLVPFLLPPIALAIGWVFLASESAGYLNSIAGAIQQTFGLPATPVMEIGSWPGLVFVYTLHLVPFAYLIIQAAFRNIDGAQDEASRMSGSGVLRTFFRVSVPAIAPAIASAALLCVVTCFALYSVPSIIGTRAEIRVLPVVIVELVRGSYPPQIDVAVVLSALIALIVGTMWWLERLVAGRGRHAVMGGKGSRPTPVRLGGWKWPARLVMIVYLAMTSVLPIAALLLVSLQPFWAPQIDWSALSLANYTSLFSGVSVGGRSLITSGLLGIVAATIGIVLAGLLVIYGREAGGWRQRLFEGSMRFPGAISHIVIGVAFVATMTGAPFYLQGTLTVLLLAFIVLHMPQAAVAAGSARDQIGDQLFEASRMSGASPARTVRKVTLPLMAPGLLAGWALLFVLSIGDLTASALLSGTSNPVVGFVILNIWENGTYSALAAMAMIITVVSAVVVGVSTLFDGKTGLRLRGRPRTATADPATDAIATITSRKDRS